MCEDNNFAGLTPQRERVFIYKSKKSTRDVRGHELYFITNFSLSSKKDMAERDRLRGQNRGEI